MDALEWILAVPYFAGGLLIWPFSFLFNGGRGDRFRWLRFVFLCTLLMLTFLGGILGVVALFGRFNHNWLPLTLLFPLINLTSVCLSLFGISGKRNMNFSDENERLFEKGNANFKKFGRPLRWSSGGEPDTGTVLEVAQILAREPFVIDGAGYECELFAAAISEAGRVAYVESRAKDAGPNPHGYYGRKIDIAIRIHLVERDGTNLAADIESYNPFFGCDVRFFQWVGETAVLEPVSK